MSADFPFKNNVPDPLLSGPELPTFKFALEQSTGKVSGGSFGKEATVSQLPISKGIAGVSMRLEPGVTRELHWHATAAEWAFVLEGRVRTTIVDPAGRSQINDYDPGDIWYFPRGFPHALSCLGDKPCQFILIFDNGYFSEFGTFSITDWMGHASPELLAKNFGVPADTFVGIPKEEIYFARGPVAPAEAMPLQGALTTPPLTHRFRMMAQEPHSTYRYGREWRVGANRFPVSETITGVVLDLDAGGLREFTGTRTPTSGNTSSTASSASPFSAPHGRYRTETLAKGDVAYIPQGYGHSIENIGPQTGRILIGLNTGDYQAIDLSQWIASTPAYLLADHFNKPASAFADFPKTRAFISPPDNTGPREIK